MTDIKPHDGDVLAWIDVETTGLDAHYDYLLEVACIVTDTQLRPLAEPFHRVVFYGEDDVEWMKGTTSEYVREMHEKTGLWDKLPEGTERPDVDQQLKEYISSVAPEKRQARVAGNSVRLDLNFLETELPETYGHLHYRFVDVTGFEYLLSEWGITVPGGSDNRNHDALGDITESIDQLWLHRHQLKGLQQMVKLETEENKND